MLHEKPEIDVNVDETVAALLQDANLAKKIRELLIRK